MAHTKVIPAKHPNSNIIRRFLEIISWGDSGRILLGFWKNSERILKGFCKDSWRLLEESGRILMILEGFQEDSEMLLQGFWDASGGIQP